MATCESDGAQRSPKGETSAGRERIKRETGSAAEPDGAESGGRRAKSQKAAKPRDLETLRRGDLETRRRGAVETGGNGAGERKRKAAKKPRRRSLTPEEVLAGMRPEEIEEIQALLGREQSAADFRRVDLERFNHAVLVFFQRVFAVMHLRPFQVEKLTCVTHQHQLKLHPHAHAEEDVHVNLYLAGQICNGLHLRLLRVLEWVAKKCTPVWPLLAPLEA